MKSVSLEFQTYIFLSLFLISTVFALVVAARNEKAKGKDRRIGSHDSLRLPFVWYIHKYLPPRVRFGFYVFWFFLAVFLAFRLLNS